MDRLWTWDRPATVREVVDDINRQRPIAYTTVMTVADILYGKGVLTREKQGRAWLYRPALSREAYTAALMQEALDSSRDRPAALAHFIDEISPDELEVLRGLLDARPTPEGP